MNMILWYSLVGVMFGLLGVVPPKSVDIAWYVNDSSHLGAHSRPNRYIFLINEIYQVPASLERKRMRIRKFY